MRFDADAGRAVVELTTDERRLVENVLRVTLDEDYIHVDEFPTRMGWERSEALQVLTAATATTSRMDLTDTEVMFLTGSFAEILLGLDIGDFAAEIGDRSKVEELYESLRDVHRTFHERPGEVANLDLVHLRQVWERFEALPRPAWPQVDESDELGDLIADLFLPETFIAGLATTALQGGTPAEGIDTDLSLYRARLESLHVSPDDQASLDSTRVWLDALGAVADALEAP